MKNLSWILRYVNSLCMHAVIVYLDTARKDYAITGSSGHAHALAEKEQYDVGEAKKVKMFAALGEILLAG